MNGFFITFEGIEGTGKTTQVKALQEALSKKSLPVLTTREPGGSSLGDKIRKLLADPENEMSALTEFLLFSSARAEHADKFLRPWLEEGYIIISDRFTDSSLAYQSFGRGIPENFVKEVNSTATWGISPNLTFYLDLTPEESVKRVKMRLEEKEEVPERLEREKIGFFRKVRDGYLALVEDEPNRFRYIDGTLPANVIHEKILNITLSELKKIKQYNSLNTINL